MIKTPHIIIHMEGGIIQEIISPFPLDYTEITYDDIRSLDPADLCDIPQGNETTARAFFLASAAEVNPDRVREILKATETPCRHTKSQL